MFEEMKWEKVYELWQRSGYCFPKALINSISVETVLVEYKQDSYI